VISRSGGPRQVTLDIGGYRARREESLRRMARRAADEANRSGLPVSLEPMPPGERRVVHLELQEVSGIRTESQGEEPYRRVVVRPTEPSGGRAPRSPARVAYRPRV
jgi:spoIIIJ-associated protein